MRFLRTIHIKSWLKNVLIFIPFIFGRKYETYAIISVLQAFLSFSLISSAIYIMNDIKDLDNDRQHPVKCKRPLASGEITVKSGIRIMFILVCMGAILCPKVVGGQLNLLPLAELFLYIIINLGYSFGLKNYPILDVTILGIGFTVRVFFGAAVLEIGVSNWVLLTTFSGALYLSFGKRKNELKYFGTEGRKVLKSYSEDFLEKSMQSFMTLCLVFYSLACFADNTVAANLGVNLTWTIPLVMLICLRYNLNLSRMEEGDPVTVILGDRWLVLLVAVYVVSVVTVLYLS